MAWDEKMAKRSQKHWQVCKRFLELRSRWLTLIGETLQDERGQILEYWRVEKADSVVIVPIQSDRVILPPPTYRPGLGELTLDFPGGRVPEGQSPKAAIPEILKRELGIETEAIIQLTPLNIEGWAINSSFSNQKLYGCVAQIEPTFVLSAQYIGATYPAIATGVRDLLQVLTCLQCRAVLLEWWLCQR